MLLCPWHLLLAFSLAPSTFFLLSGKVVLCKPVGPITVPTAHAEAYLFCSNGVLDGRYSGGSRSFEPCCKCLFPVSQHSTIHKGFLSPFPSLVRLCLAVCFHLTVCGTLLKQSDQVGVRSCLVPVLVFPYNCLSAVTVYPRCAYAYLNVCPHVILTVQSGAVSVVSLSDTQT